MKYICIQQNDDGTLLVNTDAQPVDMEGAQPAQDLEGALELVRQAMTDSGQMEEGMDGMESARNGYAKRAAKPAEAPNPLGMFGE